MKLDRCAGRSIDHIHSGSSIASSEIQDAPIPDMV